MKLAIIAATAALFVVASGSPTHNNGGDDALVPFAAAAPDSNPDDCFCQCKTLGYVDRWGTKHGNCKTTINGKQWCFVDNARYSRCPDLKHSSKYPGEKWSTHACYTPAPSDPECSIIFPRGRAEI